MGLFDAFLGKSQRKDLQAAQVQAGRALDEGLGQYKRTAGDYLDRSLAFLAPDIEAGSGARNLLLDALGVNGADAQRGYFGGFQVDPQFQAETDAGIDATQKSVAAGGNLFSGSTLKALTGYAAGRRGDAFNTRINQLSQLAGLGSSAAGASAGLTQQTGQGIADAQFGSGQLRANNATNFGNAMAASRSIPINNLLAIGNIAAKAYGAA